MLKEICLEKYEKNLMDIRDTKCPASKSFQINRLAGYIEGLFWANVIDSDEYMKLNQEINACYLD